MCEFQNGDVIEYQNGNGWVRGTYIGKYPTNEGHHVICTIHGVLRYGSDIRKPKQKKEGWINVYSERKPGIQIYPSKEEARISSTTGRVLLDTVKIEWEE